MITHFSRYPDWNSVSRYNYYLKHFLDIDDDWIERPLGNRGKQRLIGEDIFLMITDSQLYKEFHQYAIDVLKLNNTS